MKVSQIKKLIPLAKKCVINVRNLDDGSGTSRRACKKNLKLFLRGFDDNESLNFRYDKKTKVLSHLMVWFNDQWVSI